MRSRSRSGECLSRSPPYWNRLNRAATASKRHPPEFESLSSEVWMAQSCRQDPSGRQPIRHVAFRFKTVAC